MKKILLIALLIPFVKYSKAQHFEKLGSGLTIKTFPHQQGIDFYLNQTTPNGEIYNVYYDTVTSSFNYGKEFISVRLQIYTGTCWLFSKPIKLFANNDINAPRILDIEAIGNDIYLSGSFDSSENNLGGGFIKFSSGNWSNSGIKLFKKFNVQLSVNKMLNFNSKLFITGNFDSIPFEKANGILIYNGVSLQNIGLGIKAGLNTPTSITNTFFDVVNDSLIAYSRSSNTNDSFYIGGKGFKKAAVLRGNIFYQTFLPNKRILATASYKNLKSYILQSPLSYANGLCIETNNHNFQYFSLPDSFYVTTYLGNISIGNNLYFLVQNSTKLLVDIYQFDGNNVIKKSAWKLANQYLTLDISALGNKLILSGNFNSISNSNYNDLYKYIAKLDFTPACVISGNAFVDLNNDKIKQQNEPVVPNAIIFDNNLRSNTMANASGKYSLVLPLNNTLKLESASALGYNCSTSLNLSSLNDTLISYDFPYEVSNINDLKIFITSNSGNKILQGSTVSYTLSLLNSSPNNQSINLQVFHSPKIKQLIGENFSPIKFKNYFTFPALIAPNSTLEYRFKINYAADSFSLNEKVKVTAKIVETDIDLANNIDSVTQIISAQLASYYKTASPTTIQKNNNLLNYTIFYKNDGTDTAVKVTILDTLDNLLDIARLTFGNETKDITLNNNVIQWNIYNNLMPGASGSVGFNMKVFPSAKVGDSILNHATVYLAYLKPKVTNIVKVKFVKPTKISGVNFSKHFSIYPNPASNYFQYKNIKNLKGNLQILDINGKIILEKTLLETDEVIIPNTIAKGIYTLYIPEINSAIGKIIIQ